MLIVTGLTVSCAQQFQGGSLSPSPLLPFSPHASFYPFCFPLPGREWLGLLSPPFVYCLLRYVSGVAMLDEQAAQRWGDRPEWRAYIQATNLFVPWPPRTGGY